MSGSSKNMPLKNYKLKKAEVDMTDLGVADDAGGGASRRHIEEVHGLAGQELAQA